MYILLYDGSVIIHFPRQTPLHVADLTNQGCLITINLVAIQG